MKSHDKFGYRFLALLICCLAIVTSSGCSSLGLSTWPSQFQLLPKTKQMAASSPLPSGMPNELSKIELASYYIEPGDRILIEPDELESEISSFGDQKVQVDGSVDLGKFGRIRVTGLTVEEIEHAVTNQLATCGETESINVRLVESNAAEVYVIGEVGSPAAYPINGHEHVLDAILRAGGLTSKASPCDIILVRPTSPDQCRVVLPICYRQITQLGDVTTNYQIQPGDRIVVGSRSAWEEFAFWKQNDECARCCRSCCVECQPTNVQYGNRFVNGLQSIMLSSHQTKGGRSIDVKSLADPNSNSYYAPATKSTAQPSNTSDEDLFLPRVKPIENDAP